MRGSYSDADRDSAQSGLTLRFNMLHQSAVCAFRSVHLLTQGFTTLSAQPINEVRFNFFKVERL